MTVRDYNRLVEEYFNGKNHQEGEVGIEIEVEGTRLLKSLPSYWSVHEDGSLRGESAEYVLGKPIKRLNVLRFLQYLKKRLDDNGAVLTMSNRTSVHIHLNMQGWSIRQVYSLCCMYLLFEGILTRYAGQDRVGNLFCLRASDAEFLINRLVGCATEDMYSNFTEENRLRYASLNICALPKFNSLEFRAFRGTCDPDAINAWVTLLLCIKDAAEKYPDPRSILHEFSALGTKRFFEKVFPPPFSGEFNWPWYEIETSLWESMRLVQDVAFATQWEVGPPIRPRMFQQTPRHTLEAAGDQWRWNGPNLQHVQQANAVIQGPPRGAGRAGIDFRALMNAPREPEPLVQWVENEREEN